jgi:hypothetical protein
MPVASPRIELWKTYQLRFVLIERESESAVGVTESSPHCGSDRVNADPDGISSDEMRQGARRDAREAKLCRMASV